MSWFSSWLPQLPALNINLTLPTSIQSRFLSFILKKTLGHFFKPGQLDVSQIDSQIGSGFVQVKDLEFDDGAMNAVLAGFPLTFTSGMLSSATVRIPWPNPLTSNLGFSLHALHLTFEVASTTPSLDPETDLASSVASVAETFLHEELTPREEASLLDSLHSSLPGAFAEVDQDIVPGGLDPFNTEISEQSRSETDPGGISLFATLIERLLSRFEFDAHDIRVTIVHPDNVSISFILSEIQYSANTRQSAHVSPSTPNRTVGITRSLTLNGVMLQMKDLRRDAVRTSEFTTSASPELSTHTNIPQQVYQTESSSSSSSSLDEETIMAMSQSLASLPPRQRSPSQSAIGSMYQSALSVINEQDDPSESATPDAEVPSDIQSFYDSSVFDETVFSIGSSPVAVRMSTMPPAETERSTQHNRSDKVTISMQTGLLSFSVRSWHIRGLLCLSDAVISRLPQTKSQPSSRESSSLGVVPFEIETSIELRGVVFLILPSYLNTTRESLEQFFRHPLIPPPLPSGYLRLTIEGIACSLVLPSQNLSTKQTVQAMTSNCPKLQGTLSIHNVSIFAFRPHESDSVLAFPILFTDPHLPSQYTSPHCHPNELDGNLNNPLPSFDLIDWTTSDHQRKGGARLSYWRCKSRTRQQARRLAQNDITTSSSEQDEHAFMMRFHREDLNKEAIPFVVEGKITPLHVLLDLGSLIGDDTVIQFLEEVTEGLGARDNQTPEDLGHVDGTPPATPRAHYMSNLERERRRTERIGLDGLYLEHDYDTIHEQISLQELHKTQAEKIQVSLHFAALRIEVRVSPPHSVSRSGALVIDFQDIDLRNCPKPTNHRPHFLTSEPEFDTAIPTENQALISAECNRIVIAHSLVGQSHATALLSLGPLSGVDEVGSLGRLIPGRPRISLTKSQAGSGLITALNVELPSAHAVVSKELLDGLQFLVDDASQLFERLSQRTTRAHRQTTESTDISLIGSHFFSKPRNQSGSALMNSTSSTASETVVRVAISEAFLRAWVPRTDKATASTRPFDVFASELNALVELKPEGKEETVVTLGVLDAKVLNVFKSGKAEALIQLTAPRNLISTPRPLVKLRFVSSTAPGTTAKETKVKLTLCDITCNVFPDIEWAKDLGLFVKSPPGTFESVIPTERTNIMLTIMDGSIRAFAPTKPGAVVLYIGDAGLSTEITGKSLESTVALNVQYSSILAIDDVSNVESGSVSPHDAKGVAYWKSFGYALVVEVAETNSVCTVSKAPPIHVDLTIDGIELHLHLAADTLNSLSALIGDIASTFKSVDEEVAQETREPTVLHDMAASQNLMAFVDDIAFRRPPEIGPAPDMINDDLPTNPEFLDESYGAAAGLREFSDDELDDLEDEDGAKHDRKNIVFGEVVPGTSSSHNGETIKVHAEGINIIEEYYDNLPAELSESPVSGIDSKLKIRLRGGHATLFLYDGYDWVRTRKVIEEEVKEMRRRLAKIRQLVASGQEQEFDVEEANTVLFNSVHIGIDPDVDMAEPDAFLAAIDEELKDDVETASQSSWQSLRPTGSPVTGGTKQRYKAAKVHGKKLTRSKGPSMEFKLMGLNADVDQFYPDEILVSKTFVAIRDVEILDHIKTSTWKKFLTTLSSDSRGNIRETNSDMVRIELRGVRPSPGHLSEEARLRAKILPLRLYVDQDAVDFLKKFFSFKDPSDIPDSGRPSPGAYIQLAEIFPIDLKLDYKPRRVDYRALREGRTIELMNFFHFDGAEMTLRHITLAGITGWPRLFEMLNDLWTPDVKATQLVDVISGVAPIRSMVNVGSGVADLVLLPISQYKKDGRIVRGMQKGATAFVKSTAIEAIKMGARLATGTQVILEHAEHILGGQISDTFMTESLQVPTFDDDAGSRESEDDIESDLISKYAEQPTDIREGVQSAYQSLRRNLNSAAQTILAVPMEVYERSGTEGPVRSVIRAVPIAVLKPMIGASEAISKTLLGLHNTLDPNVQQENEAKYKHR